MKRAFSLGLVAAAALCAQSIAPDYTQSSIVHAATNRPGGLAPNTIATLYGVNLAASTRALQASDVRGGHLPFSLPGTGTHILIGGIDAPLYYASPTQVNFLVPTGLADGVVRLTVVVDGISGRAADVPIVDTMPGLFLTAVDTPAAQDVAGRVITNASPAIAGQWLILYATGLGMTQPKVVSGEVATIAAQLVQPLLVWLGDLRLTPAYAGLAPGYAGLYQVNVLVPENAPLDPEIRIETAGAVSPTGVLLPLRKAN